MIMYRYGRVPLSTGHASKMSNPSAHPGQMILMNDGSQTGNFAIKGVAVPAAQLHQRRRVAGRAVG